MKLELFKNMGLRWTLYRTQYEIKKKFGYLEKAYKPVKLDDIYIGNNITKNDISKALKNNLSQLSTSYQLSDNDKEKLLFRTSNIMEDNFLYFSNQYYKFKGWNYSAKTDMYAPNDKHWSKISDFASGFGDIKWIWELNRFTFSYDLVRAYMQTGEGKYVERFWNLFEDFVQENPLEIGVNYKCSQEMSFRANAWIFALFHFIDHPSSTEERVIKMIKSISHYSKHISKHLNFSVEAVKNNHSISEATTLTVIGNTFDFLPDSSTIYKKGHSTLEKEIAWQIKEDGTFIQHSHNYHRLVLQNISWYIASTVSKGKEISEIISKRAKASLNYFKDVTSESGSVPNYGMNDGAYIIPLTERLYSDYRPVLQCLNYQLNYEILFEDDSVNELMILLNKDVEIVNVVQSKKQSQSVTINNQGGYHALKYGDFKVYVKSKTYHYRPGQADMNHVDIWYKGQCIFGDAGTYSYNDESKVLNYFNGTFSHNTVLINEENQMKKGDRFIWFNWSKSNPPILHETNDSLSFMVELLNYNQYKHRRKVTLKFNQVIIEDEIVNDERLISDIKLQWLTELPITEKNKNTLNLNENHWDLEITSEYPYSLNVYNAEENDFRGWVSSTYGEKHPANQIVYNIESNDESIKLKSTLNMK